jgi:hypothetical protein
VFADISTPEELDEIKDLITRYYAEKIDVQVEEVMEKKGITPEDVNRRAKVHKRRSS